MIEARLERKSTGFPRGFTLLCALFVILLINACSPESNTANPDILSSVDVFHVLNNKGNTADGGQVVFLCESSQECDDFDPCTDDECDALSGACTHVSNPNNQECSQTCFLVSDCDDNDPCTEDSCENQTCTYEPKTSCLATSCVDDEDCSGSVCVDGYCCSSFCDGPCMACNLVGWEGTCTPVIDAPDPDTCADPDTCDASGVCASDKCNGIICPPLVGYNASCNTHDACEYTPVDNNTPWRTYDIWIYLPPGLFQMGGPESEGGGDEERPVHQVNILDGFLMSKYEITVVAYEACKSDGNCTASSTVTYDGAGWGVNRSDKGRQTHPQNGLTKTQTEEFCAWNASGGRLPSEAEWEYAASGNEEHRTYPWGNSPEPNCDDGILNFNPQGFELSGYGCENGGTFPVGSFIDGASPFGILDMAGNVWEWVQDCQHDTYEGAPIDGSAWLEDCVENYRFIQRGGGFLNPAIQQRNAARISSTLYKARAQVGGRCVRPLP